MRHHTTLVPRTHSLHSTLFLVHVTSCDNVPNSRLHSSTRPFSAPLRSARRGRATNTDKTKQETRRQHTRELPAWRSVAERGGSRSGRWITSSRQLRLPRTGLVRFGADEVLTKAGCRLRNEALHLSQLYASGWLWSMVQQVQGVDGY